MRDKVPTRRRSVRIANEAQGRVAIVYRRISELKIDPNNPRLHSPQQVRQIANSISTFGFNVPVLVDANLKVIAGHGRILACQLLGWTEVPTIRLEHLTEPQAKAFMIADNRLTEIAVWDDRILAEQLRELSVLDLDFDLEATGFAMGEIDLRIEGLKSGAEDEEDPADALASVRVGPRVSRPGSLWLLGPHRVLCASAQDKAAYALLMQKEHAGMMFTDPPFNIPIQGNVSGHGSIQHRDFQMAIGEMNETEFTEFLRLTCVLLAGYSSDGSDSFHHHGLATRWRVAGCGA
jgi:hypothetical protein